MRPGISNLLFIALAGFWASACGDDHLSRAQMMDPETCKDCHPKHFEEWQASMHAYAADDPVFLAMNARGQRETNGALGDFCVQCHAPMAVREGATTDGLNLGELPQHLKGITCYFCHTVKAVEGTHNNPLVLANNTTMRGGIDDPKDNGVHPTAYSSLHDRDSPESATLCGSCHDIVTDNVHLERTFSEWKDSVFTDPPFDQSCSVCHMTGSDDVVADFDGVPIRRRHSHLFPAVDTALTEWPGKPEMKAAIEEELRTTVQSELCYNPGTNAMDLTLTNVAAGHMFPSGSSQDRRAWVELTATVGANVVLESGVIADGESVDAVVDPLLWRMHDTGYNADDEVEHMFWNIVRVESELLPPSVTFDMTSPDFDHSKTRSYPLGANPRPDQVDVVVRLRAIDLALIDELIASGDLDPVYRDRIETYDLEGSRLVWTPELAGADLCVP
jgi:hypothetical protein